MPDPGRTKLQRIIALAFRMHDEDEDQLYAQLRDQRIGAYRAELADQAAKLGRRGVEVPMPSGDALAWIEAQCRRDAASIVQTYNRQMERQLTQMIEDNALRNRYQWGAAVNRWADARAATKDREIALNTDGTARTYAREQFVHVNELEQYVQGRLEGPPPVCETCTNAAAAGWVDADYMKRYPMPNHLRCEHGYRTRYVVPPDVAQELWIG